jgi:hypothetical protein
MICQPTMADMPDWLSDGFTSEVCTSANDGIYVKTKEGTMRADWGDYIIQGVQGELYPCKPGIFEATYDAVPDLPVVPPIQILREDQLPSKEDGDYYLGLFVLLMTFAFIMLFIIGCLH